MPTRMGTGMGTGLDGFKAGKQAAEQAVGQLQDVPQKLVMAFVSTAYDLPSALSGIREVTGNTPLIGCTSYGEISNEQTGKAGVSLAVIASTDMTVNVGIGRGLNRRELPDLVRDAIAPFSAASEGSSEFGGRTVALFMDGLQGGGEALLQELMVQTGMRYQVFGGLAGDNAIFEKTSVFYDGEAVSDAFVCAEILSKRPFGLVLSHGWTCNSSPMRVTSADGLVLNELNAAPAWEAYQEYAEENGLEIKPGEENHLLLRCMMGIDFPFGTKVRAPVTKNEDGSLICGAEVPQGSVVRLMDLDRDEVLDRCRTAVRVKVAELQDNGIAGALTIECAGVQLNLNDDISSVARNTHASCSGAPTAGYTGYGQLARIEDGFEGLAEASSLVCLIPA